MSRGNASLYRTAALLLLGGAAALGVSIPVTTTVRAAEDAPITIKATGLAPIPNPSTAFNRMAQAMGLFAKHGLVFQPGPKLAGSGPVHIQALVANDTDVATSDIIAALGGIYSGAKIKVLMVLTPYGDEEVWGRNKYKTLKDAVGQTWAVASLGGAQRFNDQMASEGMGFKPNAFSWVAIPGGDAPHLQAIVTGRTQLSALSHLGAQLAEAKGYTKQIHVLVPHTAKYTPPIPRLVVVAKTSWIKDHKEAATHYVEMMLDAARQWEQHANAWVKPSQEIWKSGLTGDELRAAWKEFRDGGYFSINGGVNFAGTQKVMNLFFKLRHESPNRYLSKPSDVYDTGPLKAALNQMGVFKQPAGLLPDTPDWYKSASTDE